MTRAKKGYKFYLGIEAKYAKPTKSHKPAIWEAMLGTVYAMSPDGEIKYFDYNWDEAAKFAQVHSNEDLRVFRVSRDRVFRWGNGKAESYMQPRLNKLVLWAKR